MRERWLPVGVLAGVLFLANVGARLVVKFGLGSDSGSADTVMFIMLVVVGLTFGVLAFRWGRDRPVGRLATDLGAAALAGCLLAVLLGPLASLTSPFADGAGSFFAQIWLYAGFLGGGVLLGFLLVTALGQDHRSRSLKRFADAKMAKPRRVVRR